MTDTALSDQATKRKYVFILVGVLAAIVTIVLYLLYFHQANPEPKKKLGAVSAFGPVNYQGPIIIEKGGTYTGNWESKDSNIPAVDIQTSEPVEIINSNIRGAGFLVKSWYHNADITIRNTNAYGLAPTPTTSYPISRRFVAVNDFKNLVIENCYLEHTAGVAVGDNYKGDGSPENTIRIRFNIAKNIDGRIHDSTLHSQFVQFNFRGEVPHVEVAWNQIINEPDRSLVEDNISIFNSRGTPSSPIRIHNNFIQGAYPISRTDTTYTGGGILAEGDGSKDTCTAYVEAFENHLVNLGNYSMGIAGGNNIRYYNNRAINSATFSNGSRFPIYTSGFWSLDYYKKGTTHSNSIERNTIGIMAWGWPENRRDLSDMKGAEAENNTFIPGKITRQHEKAEFMTWQKKLRENNIIVGPIGFNRQPIIF